MIAIEGKHEKIFMSDKGVVSPLLLKLLFFDVSYTSEVRQVPMAFRG
jgi:hypothetical protein